MADIYEGAQWMSADKQWPSLCAKIDELLAYSPQVLIAIDGDCGSGKSTLAEHLRADYDGNVLHMDHFFLRPEQRTEARFSEPGGNVDYERFSAEVLTPLKGGQAFAYRPFDCRISDFGEAIPIQPRRLNIIEGAYSLHPVLSDAYHIKVFLSITPDEQLRRIAWRDGEKLLKRFETEWIPKEKRYFAHFDIVKQCDFVFEQ